MNRREQYNEEKIPGSSYDYLSFLTPKPYEIIGKGTYKTSQKKSTYHQTNSEPPITTLQCSETEKVYISYYDENKKLIEKFSEKNLLEVLINHLEEHGSKMAPNTRAKIEKQIADCLGPANVSEDENERLINFSF